MAKIFKILSNIKHNGTDYLKGTFTEEVFSGIETLINDGVLIEIAGANTIEEAKKLDSIPTIEEAIEEEVVEEKDTWAPEADPTEEVAESNEVTEEPEAESIEEVTAEEDTSTVEEEINNL